MAESPESCVQPSRGPILAGSDAGDGAPTPPQKENLPMLARVGKAAPDFEATAFVDGGFRNVKLSDYKGRWVLLCFYPGDFTFV